MASSFGGTFGKTGFGGNNNVQREKKQRAGRKDSFETDSRASDFDYRNQDIKQLKGGQGKKKPMPVLPGFQQRPPIKSCVSDIVDPKEKEEVYLSGTIRHPPGQSYNAFMFSPTQSQGKGASQKGLNFLSGDSP